MILETLKKKGIGFEAGPEAERSERSTLVMLHGAGGSTRIWEAQTKGLGDVLNTLALDLPGHGETAGKGMSSIEGYAEWLGRLLGDLFEAPVFLMGHSMGGAIVQESALRWPGLIRGLILVGTGARLQVAPAFLEGFQERFEDTLDMVIGYAFASGADPALAKRGAQIMKSAGSRVVHDDFTACNAFDRRETVQQIKLPCLIACGEEDKLTPVKLSKSLHESIPGSRLKTVPAAGHFVMMEKPEFLNRCIRDFCLDVR
jgi:pimeloyl-ACP methyl ester carboxylesterase